ncbi:STAS domain-containing protein [Salsuginibacillus kocurii]|uniref:STAS domain-containing protein n=1 Tax=Salsuginibacillus kocurii TaxID=427078 RepID=UPI0003793672|nr:STAS domain-containing protein [Salsuginibacillus kocurii]
MLKGNESERLRENLELNVNEIVTEAYHLAREQQHSMLKGDLGEEAFIHHSSSFISGIIRLLGDPQADEHECPIDWEKEFGFHLLNSREIASILVEVLPFCKKAIWKYAYNKINEEQTAVLDVFTFVQQVDDCVENIRNQFDTKFLEDTESIFSTFEEKIKQLSAPLIPVSKDLAILPLIGETDIPPLLNDSTILARAQDLEISTLIVELSGISHIDTMVAQHIFTLSNALKLVGIEVILTGISPAVAQTSVNLELPINSRFKIYSTLSTALSKLNYTF